MPSVSDFLIERLENSGVKHVFGVPGDYILHFYAKLTSSKIQLVTNTDENHSGFAADAYARVAGIGCVCVTYNVGALKLCNAIAGAYSEKSPVVVISGSPGIKERNNDFLLHHMVRGFDNQKKMFENITCHSVILDDPTKAGYAIDEAFDALQHFKQPVYIELPRDVADEIIKYDVYEQGTPAGYKQDPQGLQEALEEVCEWIKLASRPVIIAGVQINRFGFGSKLVRFAERHKIPMTTTLLSKSTVDERHPLFLGVYSGASTTSDRVRNAVDRSDCLLLFGELLTDMTLGFQSPRFEKNHMVLCSAEGLKVRSHNYSDVLFDDFCKSLFAKNLGAKPEPLMPARPEAVAFQPKPETLITTARFFEKVNSILDESMAVVADIGECLFGALQLVVSHHHFFSPAFYCSMGFSIPGALGVQLAKPQVRPIVLVGDGSFQMSVSELSTILEHNLRPIVFVLNNLGYTTERFLIDGKFNNIRNWNYHKITELLNGGIGFQVQTEQELEDAVKLALASKTLTVINVCVKANDTSPVLRKMTEGLAKKIS